MQSKAKSDNETNDLVLKVTRGILIFSKWIMVLAIGVLAIIIPALPFTPDKILVEMGRPFVNPPGADALWMLAAILTVVIVILLIALFAINRLRKIVDSVGEGNPFTRINGVRLRGIGIAAFLIQLCGLIVGMLGTGLVAILGATKPGETVDMGFEANISLSGILLVLLLIILARVFDRGAEMQEELEGTI